MRLVPEPRPSGLSMESALPSREEVSAVVEVGLESLDPVNIHIWPSQRGVSFGRIWRHFFVVCTATSNSSKAYSLYAWHDTALAAHGCGNFMARLGSNLIEVLFKR